MRSVSMAKKVGLPKWGELVKCTVTRITPFAAWCRIDDYETESGNPIEGMIHISEVAGKWVKDIRKFVKPDKQYVAKVTRIDYVKGYINLSLKRVTKYDKKEKLESSRQEKKVEGIMLQLSNMLGKGPQDVQREIFDRLAEANEGDVYAGFEEASKNPQALTEAGVPKEYGDALLKILENSFKEKELVIKANLKISVIAGDGIVRIKEMLKGFEKKSGADVKYISAPSYLVELKTKEPKEAEKKLREELEDLVKEAKKNDGEGSYELLKG
jgi:translation initiation factor 2 subunit 1